MLRTADGTLHVVWRALGAGNVTQSFRTATISLSGKLLATGTALSNWRTLDGDPQLVRDGSGMRLVFEGSTGSSGCFAHYGVYTETSANGSKWKLVTGSLNAHSILRWLWGLAATVESNGRTPVAAFVSGVRGRFHVGVDPHCPALSPDGRIRPTYLYRYGLGIATDQSNGSVWVAWHQSVSLDPEGHYTEDSYRVSRILPRQGSPITVPDSTHQVFEQAYFEPPQPVALTARSRGGVYMAYRKTKASQIELWKVGSSKAMVVPGSRDSTGAGPALAADPHSRLWVVWYDAAKNVIHAVRTNTAASAFGVVRTITVPSLPGAKVTSIQAQASSGRLDVVVVGQQSTTGPIGLFHTQILAR